MTKFHVKYLLVGAGLASSSAAEAIRALDEQGELMMIGQEVNRAYHRPPLSKQYLRRQMAREELFAKPAEWFAQNQIQLRTDRRASALDTARQTITLDNGEEISFDALLIATGASARHLEIPGANLPGLFYLRTMEDCERLHHAIDVVRPERRSAQVVVIGGGVLGVELAGSCNELGLTAHLVVSGPHPWTKFAGEMTGRLLTRHLESRGVVVHPAQRPMRIEGDGRVQRVVLSDGKSIGCDFAVAAVGAVPNKDILRGTAIRSEKAIVVDERCRTSVPGIYAAGDCCAVFDRLFGKHRVIDHWDNAQVTGAIAGTNMAGGEKRYDAVSYFFSDVLDWSLSVWGEGRLVDRRLVRGNHGPERPDFVEIGVGADGCVAQVLAINHAGEDELLRELVKRRVSVEGKEEALKDPGVDLGSVIT